jgi:two-component system, OmpR family, sensor histidine kinase KdpD
VKTVLKGKVQMSEEDRPDPEKLLQVIKLQEEKSKGGKLKVFFGMSAGVGKTYAMLEDAQQRLKEDLDIVIGIINTHGRKETDALTKGLPIIPLKSVNYKGSLFTELDIDAIIKRKPQIVLVDELAHTNVPGSRHPKRWQDVIEILEAGIDVYTTLNVQHIESRKDVVEEITGIPIRETVPDIMLERASQIELVDVTPTELLRRLKEGKVYLGPQSEIAAKNFFQVDRLTALREIALRMTAEKVDHDLHGLLPSQEKSGIWKTSERLLVAVSHSPHSQRLIRTTRRYAFILDAPWIALHVDTGKKLNDKDNEQLVKNLSLARELGAEIVTVTDLDVSKAVQRIAKQKNVTQIILGRSPKKSFFENLFNFNNLFDNLNKESSDIDVHIIRQDSAIPLQTPKIFNLEFTSRPSDYWWMAFFTLAIGGICDLLSPFLHYQMVGFIFLLSIMCFSLFMHSGPLALSALLFAIMWGFLFVPVGALTGEFELSLFASFFVVSFILGILTERIREREHLLLRYEEKNMILYEIVREIATAPFSKDLFISICNRLDTLLNGKSEILLKELDNGLIIDPSSELLKDEKEKAVAQWVFDNAKMAGLSTDTLSSVNNLYIPLKGSKEIVGVLTFQPIPQRAIQPEEINLLQTICQEVANYVERTYREEKDRKAEYISQVEKIQHAILNSISREFSSPLYSIKGAARELKNPELTKNAALHSRKIQQIEESSNNLSRIIDNVLAISRLSSGFLQIKKELHDIRGLVDACLINVQKNLEKHIVKVDVADDLPRIYFDFSLMELLLCNLLINAAEYSPPGKIILIVSKNDKDCILLSVADEGSGVPPDSVHLIFEKFYRVPGSGSSGMGLGLAIVKTIADMHDAKIEVHNRPNGGLQITVFLPK